MDFLVARCDEELTARSCSYEADENGLHCRCDRPDGGVLESLARLELVQRWGQRSDPTHDLLLRTLAGEYRGYPGFQQDWSVTPGG